jgi:hypothetical protein
LLVGHPHTLCSNRRNPAREIDVRPCLDPNSRIRPTDDDDIVADTQQQQVRQAATQNKAGVAMEEAIRVEGQRAAESDRGGSRAIGERGQKLDLLFLCASPGDHS